MDTRILEEIGLTKGEIKTYLALLKLGSSSTGPIAKEAQVSRSKLYMILDRLEKKGLVSHIEQRGITYFQAVEPSKIMDYLKKKKEQLKQIEKNFAKFIPQLEGIQKLAGKVQKVTVYQGLKGLRTAHEHLYLKLKKGEEHYFLGIPAIQPEVQHAYWKKDHQRRVKAGIKCKLLFNADTDQSIIDDRNSYKGCIAKRMPVDAITPAYFQIFKDTTTIGIQSKNPLAIEIISQDIADSFKAYFDAFWKQDIRTHKGDEAIKTLFDQVAEELKPGEEWLVLGASKFSSRFDEYFTCLAQRMKEKKLKTKLLFDEDMKSQIKVFTKAGLEVKTVPGEYATPAEVDIYKNKVLTVVWSKTPRAWVVENKEIADSYRKFFDMIWGQETRTFKGLEGGEMAFRHMINSMKKTDEWVGYVIAIPKEKHRYFEVIHKLHKWRGKKGLKSRIIFDEKLRKYGELRKKIPHTKVRYVPYESPTVVNAAGNIALLNVVAAKEITVFMIHNKEVADSFRDQFERVWKQAKK